MSKNGSKTRFVDRIEKKESSVNDRLIMNAINYNNKSFSSNGFADYEHGNGNNQQRNKFPQHQSYNSKSSQYNNNNNSNSNNFYHAQQHHKQSRFSSHDDRSEHPADRLAAAKPGRRSGGGGEESHRSYYNQNNGQSKFPSSSENRSTDGSIYYNNTKSNDKSHKQATGKGTKNEDGVLYYNDLKINVENELNKKQTNEKSNTKSNNFNSEKVLPTYEHQGRANSNGVLSNYQKRNPTNENWRQKAEPTQNRKTAENGFNSKNNTRDINNKHKNESKKLSEKFDGKSVDDLEKITIYYSTPESSAEIEKNLQQLIKCDKTNDQQQQTSNDKIETVETALTDISLNNRDKITENENAIKPNSSQGEVIENVTCPNEASSATKVLGAGGEKVDVLHGGEQIESAQIPTNGGTRHGVCCTVICHPGHFYINFINEQYEVQRKKMMQFYESEEHIHIDLTKDVLKAGQYFAACRGSSVIGNKEWIRVQLLHVTSPEMINCALIDEGGLSLFRLADIQPLFNEYRSVPKQAIRVSLAGVTPKDIDYTPQKVHDFQKMMKNQLFHTGEQQFDQKQQQQINNEEAFEIELYFNGNDELKDRKVADVVIERDIACKKI